MSLDDGRFLVDPKRFDLLKLEANSHFVRVSEDFLVIALGLPVPKHDGYPLDPPFRSRFQARYIAAPDLETQLMTLRERFPAVTAKVLEQLVSISLLFQDFESDLGGSIPDFPVYLDQYCGLLNKIPDSLLADSLMFCYPYLFMNEMNDQLKATMKSALASFQVHIEDSEQYSFRMIGPTEYMLSIRANEYRIRIPTTGSYRDDMPLSIVQTNYLKNLQGRLLLGLSHGDVCILGPKGSGKSMLVRTINRMLRQTSVYVPVYKDMSSRDLLQKRGTDLNGDTIWENSGLVEAAIAGQYAILDGVHALDSGAFASLQRLVSEREISLPNGTRLVHPQNYQRLRDNFGLTEKDLAEKHIIPVHPGFRIIALGNSEEFGKQKRSWLTGEVLSMFSFVYLRTMRMEEEVQVLTELFPQLDKLSIQKVCALANSIRSETDEILRDLAMNFSTRQLKRICIRMNAYATECLHATILKVCLFNFLPALSKSALLDYLKKHGLKPKQDDSSEIAIKEVVAEDGLVVLDIDGVQCPIQTNTNPALIPKITFFENQRQLRIIQVSMTDAGNYEGLFNGRTYFAHWQSRSREKQGGGLLFAEIEITEGVHSVASRHYCIKPNILPNYCRRISYVRRFPIGQCCEEWLYSCH
jgi:MoxR-like ATPase